VHLLSLLIWLPLFGSVLVLAAGDQRPALARWLALLLMLGALALCVPLYGGFDSSTAAMQFVEKMPWIEAFNIHYHLGVDGFSMPLVLLTCFFGVIVVVASWTSIQQRVAQYMAAFLLLQGLMVGVFVALDGMLFYIFFEAMLIPMFLIIGIWGGERRVYATLKFFLYTFFGSVFMLVGLIWLYLQSGSFDILAWHDFPLSLRAQKWLFMAFFIAFAVKVPMWPVHTWLPDAHVEAPTGGSVILAAIMLKIGGYGFLRFSLPITPDGSAALDWLIIALSLIAIVYIGLVALVQLDMKKLIAYSSIAHMGFATLGFFVVVSIVREAGVTDAANMGLTGGMVQMISHGFISGALFLCVGVLYDRTHSRQISDYGGVAISMPWFATFAVLFFMANTGLPGTSGFVGEFFVILSSFAANFWYAALAALTLILSAGYSLYLVKRVFFGDIKNKAVAEMQDLNKREFAILGILALAVLLLGVWPNPLVELMQPSVQQLLSHIALSKVSGS
jgi:NADH-quinone oxidoreductase subunit M